METREVIIVGGGPGGSSCAWQLRKQGIDCLILDRETFPRHKLCGGWITPQVLRDLEMNPADYPHGLLTFDCLKFHVRSFSFSLNTVQYSIRRYEFDHWLLQRSGAEIINHEVRQIRHEHGYYIIDDLFRCKHLVGAGGTRCPVYRNLFREHHPRAKRLQVVAQEQEFAYAWQEANCHLWFFDHGLPGYAWYVPKGNGYLNIGIGGMAAKLKRHNDDIKPHWHNFVSKLEKKELVSGHDWQPGGYSYYLRAKADRIQYGNSYLVGDAAGLATHDMGEGIGPAVRSGILAAKAIASRQAYTLDTISRYSAGELIPNMSLRQILNRRR